MITIAYHKTCKPITLFSKRTTPNHWSYQKLDDGRNFFTFLYIRDDKGNDFVGAWLEGVSNPLTQLRNSDKLRCGNDWGSPIVGLHD